MKTRSITIALLCALVFAFINMQAQSTNLTEIIIGEGTESSCEVPFNACENGWAYTECIYPAEAIGESCMIYSISFDVSELPSFWNGAWQQLTSFYYIDFSIYLGTTSQSNHSSMGNWVSPEQMSIVFYRHVDIFYNELFTQVGWTTIDLDSPFPYEEGNLVIGISINSYLSWDSFENYLPLNINGTLIDGASLHIADTSTPPEIGIEGTIYDIRPNIKLGVIPGPSIITIPSSIDLGFRPSGYWMEPADAYLFNEGSHSSISSISCNNDFFTMGSITLPYAFTELDTIPFSVSHATGEGAQAGALEFMYGENKTAEVSLFATAYTPDIPDVWEIAREVNSYPYSETITNDMAVYNNYKLPGNNNNGKDAVFKLSFDTDVVLTANITGGDNAKTALYCEGFEGREGPMVDNYYVGNGHGLSYDCACDFEGELCDLDWENDVAYPWVFTTNNPHNGSYCLKSGNEGYQYSSSTLSITLDVPENTTMSFWAKISSEEWCDNGCFYIDDNSQICISGNNQWNYYCFSVNKGVHTFKWVYSKDGSVDYNDDCFYIDNVYFFSGFDYSTSLNTINDLLVHSGVYYLVASSTSDSFTVSIEKEAMPIPTGASSPFPPNTYNSYGENPSTISWHLDDFATEYQVLFGETNPPTGVLVDWTGELAETCNIVTEDSKNYYWRVNERNSSGTMEGPVWTFTTFKDINPSVDNIIYVTQTGAGIKDGSSWGNAASNIQAAIDASAAVQENRPDIWVAKGTYLANGAYEELDGHTCVFHSYNDVRLYGSLDGDETIDYDMNQRDFDANATILDAESVCYVVGSQGSNWDGFVIQHGSEGCVYNNESTSIKNCKVLFSSGNGIYVFNGKTSLSNSQVSFHEGNGTYQNLGEGWGNFEAKDCIISNNTNNGVSGSCTLIRCQICNNGNGAIITSSQGGTMIGCLVANNDGVGTDFHYVVNSTIVNNDTGIGFGWFGGMDFVLANNIIWGNNNQIAIDWGSYNYIVVVNNAIQDGIGEKSGIYPCINLSNPSDANGVQPCFVEPTAGIGSNYSGGNWSLLSNSPCINNGTCNLETIPKLHFYHDLVYYNIDEYFSNLDILNSERIQQGRIDIGAYESPYTKPNYQYPIHPDADSIIYVKMGGTGDGSSWDNAAGNLQQAIETAILYEPYATVWATEGTYTNSYSFQVKEGLKLFGGFAGNEPADYDLCQRDFNAHASVLDGGGTMRVLYQNDTLSTTTVALIDGFTLRNGLADKGAGAYILKNTSLSHCTIENNTASVLGGGIYAEEAFVKDCFVINNTASSQGGGIYAKDAQIIQSHIGNNEAETGGGVWASKSDLLQCNIVRNEGDGLCVQADDRNSFVHLDNSILWGNEGNNIHYLSNMAQANTIVKHCAIEGWNNTDNGNLPLSEDNTGAFGPWFVEPSTETGLTQELGDWQLQEASLCIDAGENVASLPVYDIIGANRIQNGRTDMGAFESPYGAQCVETDIRDVSIRQGETYEFYDVVLSEAGTYEHRWTEGSCDSLVMLHLHVADIVYVSENGSGLKDGSSWDNALDGNTTTDNGYTKLAHRLAEATPYSEFWLTDGLYLPCGDQDNTKSFTLNEGVRIYGGFAGTENAIDERDPEHEATVFTGELQADNDSTNNTECLFVTALATGIWDTPSVLDGLTLTQSYASSHQGAALRVLGNTNVILNHCEVVENYEGAICNRGRLDVTNTNLSNNSAQEQGEQFDFTVGDGACYNSAGAISNRIDGVASLLNCTVNSNHSPHSGALFNAGLMKIDNSEFDNNTSDWYGVGFSPGKIKIANSVFNNNRSDNRIGVLYVWDSLEMVNCMVSNNHSNYYAVYHYPETPSHYGGYRTSGIEANGYAYVSGCTFIGNNSNPQLGGALTINGTALIEHSSFINNKAMTPWLDPDDIYEWSTGGGFLILMMYGGPCGAALFVSGTAIANDCIFSDNKGYQGGTIGLRGTLSMNQCKITEGHLYELSAGGQFFGYGNPGYAYCSAICNWGGHLNISNSLIGNNEEGAVIQREESHTTLTNSTIVNNNGDVLNFEPFGLDDPRSWGNMNNCIVNGYGNLENLLEVGVGNDSIICVDAVININNSLLKAEISGEGDRGQLFPNNDENTVKVMVVMEDGSIREQQAISSTTTNQRSRGHRDGDTNLYDVDPMFVNPTTVLGIDENLSALDADWRLQAESPCINAGDVTLIDLDSLSLDLGGEMRVKNCEIDMGAYEYGEMIWDTIVDSHCEGEPYADNGFDLPAMVAGDYVFQRTGDCADNTIHTLLMHVNPITYSTLFVESEGTYELNGETYTESGIYTQTLPNQYGCDSIITLHLQMMATQAVTLSEGWNWWTPTVWTDISTLQSNLGDYLIQIKVQDEMPTGNISPGKMLKIQTSAACSLSLTGMPITAASITVNPGATWFGYIGEAAPITQALNGFPPAEDDKIVSQDGGYAIYNGTVWEGTLTTLEPGKGYVYISTAAWSKTIEFE